MLSELEPNQLRPYFQDVHYLALTCDDAVIEQRLRARPGSHTTLARDLEEYIDTQLWVNRAYHTEANGDPPITLLDASTSPPDALAQKIAAWVRQWL